MVTSQKELSKAAQKKRDIAKRKRQRAAKKAVNDLENLVAYVWRFICFERAGRACEVCGLEFERGSFDLQAHHVVKRSRSGRLLLDPVNSLALCKGHHQFADRDEIWGLAIVDELRPGSADYLLKARRSPKKVPIHDAITVLLATCDELGLSDAKIDELREFAAA